MQVTSYPLDKFNYTKVSGSNYKFWISPSPPHPVRSLMNELRTNSSPIERTHEWWTGHLHTSLHAPLVTAAGSSDKIPVASYPVQEDPMHLFRCNGAGEVIASRNYAADEDICQSIQLRSCIFLHKPEEAERKESDIHSHMGKIAHCRTAVVDNSILSRAVRDSECDTRYTSASAAINAWTLPPLRDALTKLTDQWKEHIAEASDPAFAMACLKREHGCVCRPFQVRTFTSALENMSAAQMNIVNPLDASSQVDTPLALSTFDVFCMLVGNAVEVRRPDTGSAQAIVFISELVQHMLKPCFRDMALPNVRASVHLTGHRAPCIVLTATRAIKKGERFAAIFDRGTEAFNPFAMLQRHIIYPRTAVPPNAKIFLKAFEVFHLSATHFEQLDAISTQQPLLDAGDQLDHNTFLYANISDAAIRVLLYLSYIHKEARAKLRRILRQLINVLSMSKTPIDVTKQPIPGDRRAPIHWCTTLLSHLGPK